jgi:hypothetical protein
LTIYNARQKLDSEVEEISTVLDTSGGTRRIGVFRTVFETIKTLCHGKNNCRGGATYNDIANTSPRTFMDLINNQRGVVNVELQGKKKTDTGDEPVCQERVLHP